MKDLLDYKSPNFLGGNNVHHVILIGLTVAIAIKVGVFKKN
jgi:hypothetical protein